ncbi:MAG: hypothetical protein AAB316_20955, partial [Bacteroidota bacterium]
AVSFRPNFYNMRTSTSLAILLLGVFLSNCQPAKKQDNQAKLVANANRDEFATYWFQGEAEVNSYHLEQSRYGEQRTGEAVLVFVTEDLSKLKQVKLDDPEADWKDKVPVLKLNHIRRFVTGIYDYSMMQSVFTPLNISEFPHTLKTTTTSQDWCGHTFTQLNLDGGKYRLSQFSYFEKEGDVSEKLPAAMLEDELLNRLRINPGSIAEGEVKLIPSTFYSRLRHQKLEPRKARIQMKKEGDVNYLVVEYLNFERSLTIGFEAVFPHKILSWVEEDGKEISSKGTLKRSLKTAYWKKNKSEFEFLRDSLSLN